MSPLSEYQGNVSKELRSGKQLVQVPLLCLLLYSEPSISLHSRPSNSVFLRQPLICSLLFFSWKDWQVIRCPLCVSAKLALFPKSQLGHTVWHACFLRQGKRILKLRLSQILQMYGHHTDLRVFCVLYSVAVTFLHIRTKERDLDTPHSWLDMQLNSVMSPYSQHLSTNVIEKWRLIVHLEASQGYVITLFGMIFLQIVAHSIQ